MTRPEYVSDNMPSIETWEEACAISQEWADGARQAAVKRRNRNAWITFALLLVLLAGVATVLALILTGTI